MSRDISCGKSLLKSKGITTNGASLKRVVSDETKKESVDIYMVRDKGN